jgi:hypothetical protein
MLGYFARFQPDDGGSKIVSPTAEGPIHFRGFCRPFHWQTHKLQAVARERLP